MGGTDRKWQKSEAQKAEVTPCEQRPYRFRPHFETRTLYASDITRIPYVQIRSSSWIPDCITREEIIIAYLSNSQIFFIFSMDSNEADIFLYKDFFVSTACRTLFQQILGKGRSRNGPILFFNL
jgi:hypothetical protein